MYMLTLYAREVVTTDEIWHKYQTDKSVVPMDIELRDSEGNFKGVIPWHHSNKPDRRNQYISLNCCRFHLVWS